VEPSFYVLMGIACMYVASKVKEALPFLSSYYSEIFLDENDVKRIETLQIVYALLFSAVYYVIFNHYHVIEVESFVGWMIQLMLSVFALSIASSNIGLEIDQHHVVYVVLYAVVGGFISREQVFSMALLLWNVCGLLNLDKSKLPFTVQVLIIVGVKAVIGSGIYLNALIVFMIVSKMGKLQEDEESSNNLLIFYGVLLLLTFTSSMNEMILVRQITTTCMIIVMIYKSSEGIQSGIQSLLTKKNE